MSNEELNFLDWVAKVTERGTFILIKIKNRVDLSEDEWDYLKYEYAKWYNGEYPLYQSKADVTDEKAVQGGLFDDRTTDSTNGTDVEVHVSET